MTNLIGDDLVKRDVAIEIMADMLGKRNIHLLDETDADVIAKIEGELKILRQERDAMYQGDKAVIEKILTVYAKEVKRYYSSTPEI